MNSLTGIIIFAALITIALVMVSFINRVQNHNRVVRIKVQQLRTRTTELEELGLAIAPLLESTFVCRLINEEVIDLIQSIIKLDPSTKDILHSNLAEAKDTLKTLSSGVNTNTLARLQPSDAAIARQQYYLSEAGKLVRRHESLGLLAETEMNAHIKELNWAHLMVGVISHIGQGHQAFSRTDKMVAQGHYRNALYLLQNANASEDRKHLLTREVSELIAEKRLAISPELMPETGFNPTPATRTGQEGQPPQVSGS